MMSSPSGLMAWRAKTTSAIGNVLAGACTFTGSITGGRSRRLRAFTILEVLMVIALIALLTGVLVTGGINLTRDKAATPEDVFLRSVLETRRIALVSGREVRLSFAAKSGDKEPALVARMADGTEQRFPFEQANQREFIIEFLVKQKGGGSMLLGGQLVETQTIPFVTFFADGTCSPFRLQIRAGGEPRVIEIDPWTCAMVLPRDKNQR